MMYTQRPLGRPGSISAVLLLILCGCGQETMTDEQEANDSRGSSSTEPTTTTSDDAPPSDTAADSGMEAQPTPGDDAAVVSWNPPSTLNCGERGSASLVMRNTGSTTWTYDDGYKLGAISDSDPFYDVDTRVWLPEGSTVPPGAEWTFEFELVAPEAAGIYVSDWQMVREYVAWFGETVDSDIEVICEPPSGEWVIEACARNGDERCDDESFGVEPGVRYALYCSEATGGISFVSSNTGPEMEDGMSRCQGWEENGSDAWNHLEYVAQTECNHEGDLLEVDLSSYAGRTLWFGSHDHPGGGGEMTSTCLVTWEDAG